MDDGQHHKLAKIAPLSENFTLEGAALGQIRPADEWVQHNNRLLYGTLGPGIHKHFSTLVSDDPRTSFAMADGFHTHLRGLGSRIPEEIIVHEYGVGNGMLAAAFLHRIGENDRKNGTDFLRRTAYVLFDSHQAIFDGLRENMFLMEFKDCLVFAEGNAIDLKPGKITSLRPGDKDTERYFAQGAVHKQMSNELADAMPSTILVGDGGKKAELWMQPYIKSSGFRAESDVYRSGDPGELIGLMAGDASVPKSYALADTGHLGRADAFFNSIGAVAVAKPVLDLSIPLAEMDATARRVVLMALDGLSDPWNVAVTHGFFRHLEAAKRLMSEDGQGYDFFDTGSAKMKDADAVPLILTRGDFCYSVPFDLVGKVAEGMGLKVDVCEPQHVFVGRQLGETQHYFDEVLQTHPGYGGKGRKDQIIEQDGCLNLLPSEPENEQGGRIMRKAAKAFVGYENIVIAKTARQVTYDLVNSVMPGFLGSAMESDPGGFLAKVDWALSLMGGGNRLRHQLNFLSEREIRSAIPELARSGFDKVLLEAVLGQENKSGIKSGFHHMRVLPA
ncbi:MAG: hypothetical protein V1875_01100 [Candidatus Altiarchaeota archaeon]